MGQGNQAIFIPFRHFQLFQVGLRVSLQPVFGGGASP